MNADDKVCPTCGSDDVEEFVAGWENPNTGAQDGFELAKAYSELYWCNECEDHVGPLMRRDDFHFVEPDDDPGPIEDRDCDYWNRIT